MAEQNQLNFIPGHSRPRSWRRLNSWDALLAAVALALVAAFAWRSMAVTRHAWDWASLWPYVVSRDASGAWQAGMLLKGLFGTLRLGFWSLLVALVSGGLVGALSARQRGLSALPGVLYITVLRNTPPLVLLFLVYFFAGSFFSEPFLRLEDTVAALPAWAQSLTAALFAPPGQLDRMAAAVLTLGVYSGAYVAEIVRGALESVDRTQWDASASLGMSAWQQMRWIIAPQAFRIMAPPLTGQCISVFKETALASAISLPELTFQSLEVMAVSRITFELWLVTAAMYLLVSCFWAWLGRKLEKRR
ncbi:amino acid ABC transporter permease [Mailhella massiliensis]|uniref:Amino acid ABC transporter permease n=1 Tax=Mailhella massiliensis TaxID=1903261 RepID=A0A921DRW9_9BACT|nr:amino acid ABC transporter permease [Mailhella massiliensis]HJD96317.1 amino acid ABC transporter permease [Mailhella massiliensis]